MSTNEHHRSLWKMNCHFGTLWESVYSPSSQAQSLIPHVLKRSQIRKQSPRAISQPGDGTTDLWPCVLSKWRRWVSMGHPETVTWVSTVRQRRLHISKKSSCKHLQRWVIKFIQEAEPVHWLWLFIFCISEALLSGASLPWRDCSSQVWLIPGESIHLPETHVDIQANQSRAQSSYHLCLSGVHSLSHCPPALINPRPGNRQPGTTPTPQSPLKFSVLNLPTLLCLFLLMKTTIKSSAH